MTQKRTKSIKLNKNIKYINPFSVYVNKLKLQQND